MRAIRKHLGDFIALIVLFVIAMGVSAYIIFNQTSRPFIPLIDQKPFTLKAQMSNAQAVTPGQGQAVKIAGVKVGKITAVQIHQGIAIVTMQLDKKWTDRIPIHSTATALLRPSTGLKDMFMELDPGTGGRLLHSGAEIPIANTAPDINPDEILSSFDTDTRSYLQLLINGAGKGLKGRGTDLNGIFKALSPTERDLNRISSAVAQRRADLRELIHRYGTLTNALADKDREIRTLVSASDAVFQSFASQQQNISAAVAKLPGTLQTTANTLTKANAYAKLLRPTLNNLRPPFRQLDATNHAVLPFVREAYPITRNHIRPFVQVARPYTRNLRPAAINLAKASPDLTASFHELNRLFDIGAYNPKGREGLYPTATQNQFRDEGYLFWLVWTGQTTDSMFSTSDSLGPLRRATLGLTCETIRQNLVENPLGGPLLGLSNALNDPGLCASQGSGGGPSPLPTLPTINPLPTLPTLRDLNNFTKSKGPVGGLPPAKDLTSKAGGK